MTMGRIGKLEAFRKRFEEGSVRFFARHGVRLHGFFEIGEVPAEAVAEHSAGGIVRPAAGTRFGRDEVASATPSGGGSSPTPSGMPCAPRARSATAPSSPRSARSS